MHQTPHRHPLLTPKGAASPSQENAAAEKAAHYTPAKGAAQTADGGLSGLIKRRADAPAAQEAQSVPLPEAPAAPRPRLFGVDPAATKEPAVAAAVTPAPSKPALDEDQSTLAAMIGRKPQTETAKIAPTAVPVSDDLAPPIPAASIPVPEAPSAAMGAQVETPPSMASVEPSIPDYDPVALPSDRPATVVDDADDAPKMPFLSKPIVRTRVSLSPSLRTPVVGNPLLSRREQAKDRNDIDTPASASGGTSETKSHPGSGRRRQLTVRVNVDQFDRLRQYARAEGMTYQDTIVCAIDSFLKGKG